jgi:hypothetical protein
VFSIVLTDPSVCIQVMILIQTRCAALADRASGVKSGTPAPTPTATRAEVPMSPLAIGSSPASRPRGVRGKGNRRKSDGVQPTKGSTSPSHNKENDTFASSSRMSLCQDHPSPEFHDCNESPSKRARRVSTGSMDVMSDSHDLLGLAEFTNEAAAAVHLSGSAMSMFGSDTAFMSKNVMLKNYMTLYDNGTPLDSIRIQMKDDGVDSSTINELEQRVAVIEKEKEEKRLKEEAEVDKLLRFRVSE